jgi:heat shock protein HtpX
MINIYESISANKKKSAIVVVFFIFFVTMAIYFITQAIGFYMGYQAGGLGYMGVALIFSGITTFASYYYSDKIVLSISGAKPASKQDNFDFYTVVENLSLASDIPMPKLYVIDDSAPNAFATGRSPQHASLCATSGLLQKLSRTELEGVVGHELSHIKNYDMRLMSVVAVLVGTVALLGDWLIRIRWFGGSRDRDSDSGQLGIIFFALGILFALLSPLIAQLIQLAISRRREFLADAGSVIITRQPSGLINALQKISADSEPLEAANKATAHLYIVNPFKDRTKNAVGWFSGLFNTHPPISERIKALQQMEE